MSLFFGDLTQQFINFTTVVASAKAVRTGSSEQVAAAAAFHHTTRKSTAGLVYIGEFKHNACILLILKLCRCWIVHLHIYPHFCLELYQRSQCQTYSGTLSPSSFTTGCCFIWQCWHRISSNTDTHQLTKIFINDSNLIYLTTLLILSSKVSQRKLLTLSASWQHFSLVLFWPTSVLGAV